jgi:hypothetical protein
LKDAGFAIERIETVAAQVTSGNERLGGPSVAEAAEYVRVMATRK